MSLFNRRSVILMTAALAGCGFKPAYGPSGTASVLMNQVVIDEPTGNNTYLLVRELEGRLGRVSSGKYGLSVSVTSEQRSIAKSISGVTSRYDVLATADYALRDLDTKEVLTSGKVDSFTGYSTTGSTVATLAAETDAYERLMVILADQILSKLVIFSPNLAQ